MKKNAFKFGLAFLVLLATVLVLKATGVLSFTTQTQQDVYYSANPLCIQQGTATMAAGDGTYTNTFAVAYNFAAPAVFASAPSNLTFVAVYNVTLSNFVIKTWTSNGVGIASCPVNWLAVGRP